MRTAAETRAPTGCTRRFWKGTRATSMLSRRSGRSSTTPTVGQGSGGRCTHSPPPRACARAPGLELAGRARAGAAAGALSGRARAGDVDGAEQCFLQALDRQPDHLHALHQLALLRLNSRGDHDSARRLLEAALRSAPDFFTAAHLARAPTPPHAHQPAALARAPPSRAGLAAPRGGQGRGLRRLRGARSSGGCG